MYVRVLALGDTQILAAMHVGGFRTTSYLSCSMIQLFRNIYTNIQTSPTLSSPLHALLHIPSHSLVITFLLV